MEIKQIRGRSVGHSVVQMYVFVYPVSVDKKRVHRLLNARYARRPVSYLRAGCRALSRVQRAS